MAAKPLKLADTRPPMMTTDKRPIVVGKTYYVVRRWGGVDKTLKCVGVDLDKRKWVGQDESGLESDERVSAQSAGVSVFASLKAAMKLKLADKQGGLKNAREYLITAKRDYKGAQREVAEAMRAYQKARR